ncbi:MAG TPA: MarR family transcriptional regulator, partial [Kofleriaceae bacterium]
MTDDALTLDNHLCFALYAASRAFTRAYQPLLEPLGLTYPQYLVCIALWERDGRAVNKLGTCLALDSGTLTPLLKRLEERGLVERKRDKADERVVKIFLTAAGKALRQKAKRVPFALAEKVGITDIARIKKLRDELVELT